MILTEYKHFGTNQPAFWPKNGLQLNVYERPLGYTECTVLSLCLLMRPDPNKRDQNKARRAIVPQISCSALI